MPVYKSDEEVQAMLREVEEEHPEFSLELGGEQAGFYCIVLFRHE